MSEKSVRHEEQILYQMIEIYCKKNHRTDGLCNDCTELFNYAKQRSENCPERERKTFCSNCKVHCYKPAMREKIRAVMRFSGPRMLFCHPAAAVRHLIETRRAK